MSDSGSDSPHAPEQHVASRTRTLTRSDSRSSLPECLIAECIEDLDPNLKFVETEHSLLQKYPFYRKESKLLVLEADDAEEEGEPEWDVEQEEKEPWHSLGASSVQEEEHSADVIVPTQPQRLSLFSMRIIRH
jgi:hypothetical protein